MIVIAGSYAPHKLTRDEAKAIIRRLGPTIKQHTERWEPAGSYRRGSPVIGDLDFVLTNAELKPLLSDIGSKIEVKSSPRLGDKVVTLVCKWGTKTVQVEFVSVPDKSYGSALLHSTGSGVFNMEMRTYARQKGMLLNQYGLFNVSTNRRVAGATEEQIFARLGMRWIPPEQRDVFWRIKDKFKL